MEKNSLITGTKIPFFNFSIWLVRVLTRNCLLPKRVLMKIFLFYFNETYFDYSIIKLITILIL